MWVVGNSLGQGVEHPFDDGWDGIDEADRGKEDQDAKVDNGLDAGEHVSRGRRDGSAGNGTIFTPWYEAIKRCVDGVIPCALCTPHDECANKEDEVGIEQRPGWHPQMGACMERAEEVWEIEISEAIAPIETHQLSVWNPCGRNLRQPVSREG